MTVITLKVKDREGETHLIEANEGDTLMEVLREYDWGVAAICGGMCSCGTCHVFIEEGATERFPEPDVDEEDLVDMLEFSREGVSRLSCQLNLEARHDGLALELAPDE
jgi:2Fe-2S ferredoxin